jgi:hypothetical protein
MIVGSEAAVAGWTLSAPKPHTNAKLALPTPNAEMT